MFLSGRIAFPQIAAYVEDVLSAYTPPPPARLADVFAVDSEARAKARDLMESAHIA